MKPYRIMTVDDDPVTLGLLEGILTTGNMEVQGFEDPFDAFQALQNQTDQYDLLITDINMPGMDGLELLRAVRLLLPLLPVIVLTSREDRETVRKALKFGANDYMDKPVQGEALLQSIRDIFASVPRKRIEESMKTSECVREVQQAMMQTAGTRQLYERGCLAFWHRPLTDAGGDFLYSSISDSGQHHLTLVDAAGHDVLSSYHVAECKGIMEALAGPTLTPQAFLSRLNNKLFRLTRHRHICALDLQWDTSNGSFHLANAGLPHGVLLRSKQPRAITLPMDGMMLGLLENPLFDSIDFTLHPGDRLLFFTDGIEEMCAFEKLAETWAELHDEEPVTQALLRLVETMGFADAENIRDDLLLLALEQPPDSTVVPFGKEAFLHLAFGADRKAIEPQVDKVLQFLNNFSIKPPSDQRMDDVAISIRELLANSVIHGNKEQMDPPIWVEASLFAVQKKLIVRVCDRGGHFDLEAELDRERKEDPLRNGRRGLLAAAAFSNHLEWDGQAVVAHFELE